MEDKDKKNDFHGEVENEVDDEEMEEEEKMDKFFELVKDFREAFKRRRNQLLTNISKKRKLVHHQHKKILEANVWVPSFQREDFADEVEFTTKVPSLTTAPDCNNKQPTATASKLEDGLDLKLSL